MKNILKSLLALLACLTLTCLANPLIAQTASWTAYKPDFFPTNASGQIHGISRVSQMKFHPTNAQKMYAVSARGGLFISTNGGSNWSVAPGCDNLPLGTRFASVCIDHTNDQILYLGGGDHNYYSSGSGVFKSTNGGTTFTSVGLGGKIIVDLIMDPNNNQVLVAATNTGVYKTLDGGATWTLKTASLALDDMKAKASNGTRVLFVTTRGAEIYRSLDFGDTWSQVTSGIYIPTGYTSGGGTRVAVTPADSNVVYFYMNAKGGTLFKSTDGGTNFTNVKDNLSPYLTGYTNNTADPGQGDYNTGLGVDRVNANIVYFVAHVVWKSTDGGATWTQLTNWYQKVHTDMHQTINSPYNNSQLWNVNDGGVWLSTDGGNNWVQKSDGIYGIEIYHGGCSPTRKDMISIGTQDNGELYATSSGWFTNRGGDWQSNCVFDYRSNSSMVYYYLPDWGTVQLPKRRLVTGSAVTYGLPASVTDFSDITYHRSNPDIGFVGDTVVWRTTNLTAATPAWTSIFNTNVKIMGMHVNYANANRLYVVTNNGYIHISNNALSATPTFTSVALPSATGSKGRITSIKSNPDVLYLIANTEVYRSSDNGLTWSSVRYNLPSYNHTEIIADEFFSTNELVFVASGGSVYYKTAGGTSWTSYSTGLPSRTSIVNMSIYNDSTANTLLRAFTYGRGVWETPISSLRSLTANFAANNTTPCPGANVTFSNLSTGNYTTSSWSFPGGTPATSTAASPVVNYATPGQYSVSLTVSGPSGSSTETKNNYINATGLSLPVTQSFESGTFPPANWTNNDASGAGSWALNTGVGGFGNSNYSMYFDNYSVDAGGAYDEFRSINIDMSSFSGGTLTYDMAYQPYSLTSYVDSLQVLVSTNCGATFTSVYVKSGASLATVTGTNTAAFVPTATQWRTESISMNAFAGQNVLLAFRNIGHYGNNLYIDNIQLQGNSSCNLSVASSITNITCAGLNNGSISVTSSGGTGTVNYVLNPGAINNSTGIFNNLAPGTYTIIATDANGCSASTSQNITQPAALSGSSSNTSIPCNGGTTTISVTASGGTAPYTGTGSFTRTAGTYTFTVSDANGCTATTSITVTQPSQLTPAASAGSIACFGDTTTISVTASGGTAPYTGTGSFTRTAGTYTFTVSDANGCTATTSITVTQPTQLTPAASAGSIACFGGTSTISVTASGGTAPYTGTGTFTRTAGTYNFTVSDANGCTTTTSITVTQPTQFTASASAGSITCFGGTTTISVTASGGTAPYTGTGSFTRTAGTYTFTVSDANGCTTTTSITVTQPSQLTPAASEGSITCFGDTTTISVTASGGTAPYTGTGSFTRTAGTYTFTVSDANGCTATTSITVTQPSQLTPTASAGSITCFGGTTTISVTASGGTAPYTGTGTFTASAGNYSYTVTDANGCSAIVSGTITQPAAVVPTITASGPTSFCNGGSVTLSTGVFNSYLWSTGASSSTISVSASGNYVVTVTDANGCNGTSAPTTVSVTPQVTASITITSNAPATVFANTSITFTANATNGGSSPIYQWKKNGVNVGTNSNTYTNSAWVNGDEITCVLTSNANCVTGSPATSNAINIAVTQPAARYAISDITQNKVFYYDASFAFIQSNTLSTATLNGVTNAVDLSIQSNYGYVLDQTNKRLYRRNGSSGVATPSAILRNTSGQALGTPTGMAISADTLWILDKKDKAIYRYSLASAFATTGNLSALQKFTLATGLSAGESLCAIGGYFYVLNNGTTKVLYRYPKAGGTGVLSMAMVNTTGTALGTVTGVVVDGLNVLITDNGLDRTLSYSLANLYSGTGNLNAQVAYVLQSTNLNSTGISLCTSTSVLRDVNPSTTIVESLDLKVYPNPTQGEVHLVLGGNIDQVYLLQVFDINGKVVYSQNIAADGLKEREVVFDLSTYGKGEYIATVYNQQQKKSLVFVVQ